MNVEVPRHERQPYPQTVQACTWRFKRENPFDIGSTRKYLPFVRKMKSATFSLMATLVVACLLSASLLSVSPELHHAFHPHSDTGQTADPHSHHGHHEAHTHEHEHGHPESPRNDDSSTGCLVCLLSFGAVLFAPDSGLNALIPELDGHHQIPSSQDYCGASFAAVLTIRGPPAV